MGDLDTLIPETQKTLGAIIQKVCAYPCDLGREFDITAQARNPLLYVVSSHACHLFAFLYMCGAESRRDDFAFCRDLQTSTGACMRVVLNSSACVLVLLVFFHRSPN